MFFQTCILSAVIYAIFNFCFNTFHSLSRYALLIVSMFSFFFFFFRSIPIFQTRWSAKWLHEIDNAIKGKRRDVIGKSSLGDLLFISPLVPPPEELLDFIVMSIDPKNRVLKYVIFAFLNFFYVA